MNGVFLQWLGFFSLITPFALACYIPFEKTSFRFGRTAAWGGTAALLAVLAVGFALLHKTLPDGHSVQLPGTLYMVASVLLGIMAYWLAVRDAAVKKLITLGVSIVGGMAEYTLASLFLFHILPFYHRFATDSYMFTIPGVTCYLALGLLVIPLLAIFFHKTLRKYFQETLPEEINRHLPFFVTATFLYLVSTIVIGVNDSYENALKNLPLRLILFAFSVFCVFETYYFLFWEIGHNRERSEFQNLLDIQRLQLERLIGDIESAKRTRHDIKYLLRSLGAMVSDGKVQEALKLIDQENRCLDTAVQHNYCKEPSLNGLLQHYAEKMRDAGISFQANIRMETPPVPAPELLILAGNLLENALAACEECGGQPFVKFNAGVINSTLVVYMENTCGEVLYEKSAPESKQAGQWLTAKDFRTRKSGGGTGLRSIEQTAKNYSGAAEYRLEDGKFVSRVILQI